MKSVTRTEPLHRKTGSPLAAALTTLALAVSLARSGAQSQPPCCPEVAGDKWLQPPDYSSAFSPINIFTGPPYVIADDFGCSSTGPIADIRLWGSFLNDTTPPNQIFTLTIWSDVPPGPSGSFSQPGTVLWSQTFGPGQYNRCDVTNTPEILFLPQWTPYSAAIATNLYYLCFTPDPSKPFVQTGTPTVPTNYWLSVSTQPQGTGGQTQFGWKISSTNYNDTAVYGVGGPPWSPIYNTNNNFSPVNMAFEITTADMPPLCGDTNNPKFYLPPQTIDGQGFDVKDSRNMIVLADDFKCTETGPITGIQVWGSWLSDMHGTITNFFVSIYSDVPAVINPSSGMVISNSHPGQLLWFENFLPGQFAELPYTNAYEYFYDPSINAMLGNDHQVYLYCFTPTNPFVQMGTASLHTNYWLAIRAQLSDTNSQIIYGWKSSSLLYNDPAVWGTVAGGFPIGNWQSMTNPFTQQPLNLSMRIMGTNTPPPPPTPCDDTNGVKYVQPPNTQNGYDVWNSTIFPPGVTDGPWILADDFICTNTGPITNIHIWGSWFRDLPAPGTITFWVALYDNVATNSANPYSHPGNLIWSQCFAPGQYGEVPWGTGIEQFLDPGPPSLLGPESNIWCYTFPPASPPTQMGTTALPMTYWLAVFAQQVAGTAQASFGWKTTYFVQNDISVHAPWNAPFCPTNTAVSFAWTPTYAPAPPTAQPLDLAFEIVTGPTTNPCLTRVACPIPYKTNECGSSWFFDPPFVTTNCCTNVVTQVVTTNAANPCDVVYTSVWTVYDCSGAKVIDVCTQVVAVVDTTPPSIVCASNKTVQCGSSWTFDPPTAYDTCFGTNVNITVVGTVTNTGSPPCDYSVTRTWMATDPCGNSTNCSQTVTIIDTLPPTLTCAPDKTVVFGSPWMFDPPMAFDQCCGTNVTVSVVSTTTNGQGCNFTASRAWQAFSCCQNPSAICTQVVTVICPDCISTNGIKYVQWPNTNQGFDVWNSTAPPPNAMDGPWLLADDFVCTNRGFITDIHIWGSWWYDMAAPGTITFWLGLFNDVAAVTNATGITPSHPGNLLWSQCFAPGHYAEMPWSSATESFMDPGPPSVLGSDSQVWYYCFFPTNPPIQDGRPYAHRIYWLGVYAQTPTNQTTFFGWKTTTNHQHDVSVHTVWRFPSCATAIPPTTLWTPTTSPQGVPLDLAFQITTSTNCSTSLLAIDQFNQTNIVVNWPNGVGVLQTSTNVFGPWVDMISAISPFTNSPPPTSRFYRLRCPPPH